MKSPQKSYSWRDGSRLGNLSAVEVGTRIEQMMRERGQQLRPADVVQEAADPSSPLHGAFEWDDTEAAAKFRLHQARMLLNAIKITIIKPDKNEVTVRLTVCTPDPDDVHRGVYSTMAHALSDPTLRAKVLEQALRDANAFHEKYRLLTELTPIFSAIEKVGGRRRKEAA